MKAIKIIQKVLLFSPKHKIVFQDTIGSRQVCISLTVPRTTVCQSLPHECFISLGPAWAPPTLANDGASALLWKPLQSLLAWWLHLRSCGWHQTTKAFNLDRPLMARTGLSKHFCKEPVTKYFWLRAMWFLLHQLNLAIVRMQLNKWACVYSSKTPSTKLGSEPELA